MHKTLRAWGSLMLLSVAMTASLSSCIKEEALNSEADITGVTLADSTLLLREPVINNNDITLYANTGDSIHLWTALLFVSLTGLGGAGYAVSKKLWK